MIILCDIDNVIADDSWRIPHINWDARDPTRRYHKYHWLCADDPFVNRHLLAAQPNYILLTAQPEQYRERREQWLQRHGLRPALVLHRKDTDHRHSAAVKRDMVLWLLAQGLIRLDRIWAAYDDRPDVVAMYEQLGINTAQKVAVHNADAYRGSVQQALPI